MLAFLLIACPGPTPDSGDSNDSDDSSIDSEAPPIDPDLGFALSGDWDGATLALIQFTPGEEDAVGDIWQTWVPDDAAFGVEAGEPPAEHFVAPEGGDFEVALYLVALFHDANSNGAHDDGEAWVGISPQWAIYAQGTMPDDLPGVVEGWNGYTPDFDGTDDSISDPLTIPVSDNLRPNDSITLGGTYAGELDAARLLVVPGVWMTTGETDVAPIDDIVLEAEWTVTLDGEPPADHFSELEGVGNAAMELLFAYTDANENEEYDPGDTPFAAACHEGDVAIMLYLPPITDLEAAWTLGEAMGTGWVAFAQGEDDEGPPSFLTGDQLTSLVIDENCAL